MKKSTNKTQHKSSQWIVMLIFVLSGASLGFWGGMYIGKIFEESISLSQKISLFMILFLIVYLSIIIQIIVHEFGHLICGLISGYDFASFRIGSFMLVKSDGKIKCKRFSLMGTGGQCLMTPPEPYNDNIPFLLYNIGGSLFNVILSVISIILYFVTRHIEFLSIFCLILAIIGIAFALINGIPMHLGAIDNDGYNAFNLRKNGAAKRCFWIQLKIIGLINDGIRLKDMPDDLFIIPSHEEMKNALCASVGVLACNRAIDGMNFKTAQEIGYDLLNNAGGLLDVHRYMITSEMIFCELITENNKEKVENMFTKNFNKFLKASAKNPSVIRMLYAHELLLKKDEQAAEKHLKSFEKVSKSYPYICEIEGERELINYTKNLSQLNVNKESNI